MAAKNDATVLAFEKKLVPSDGYLYGTNWAERRQAKPSALKLIEKSVRGTISNRLKPAIQNDPLKLNAEVEKANLQKVDACALGENQDTLHLNFTLKVLGGIDKPSACNGAAFNESYPKVAQAYIEQHGFTELAKRYAINIANGRYLWRNRVGAQKIEVVVNTGDDQPLTFNAAEFSLRNFEANNPDLQTLTDKIAAALSGKLPYLLIAVDVYALVGKAQEVYPSEELVLDKGKGDKSKILYHVNGVAAMHSQKIGNAIRTIDTWYPDYATANIGPIAVEPYGSVTNLGKAYRTPKDKADFYTLFDRFALGESLADETQQHYVMAVLVRGGVFGQSGKD
ncbi:type I-F CRISPR-associated protein Csy3 [Candidatus Methylobacter oryzae]|uniref:Type I-F CRISPR-associated protein Csy3 n=1 Tax=Candidatus Methylobacter oryzae TaxID=2497749 RepID=A0ABY3CC35_9GAMM|nr:type I-F CRISPR-associated protein Csy3 [Candidatus Methylobacter oryzae]TRW97115.1 type I-F CRISPR-associated protein Csy3 [Candidatus Methylobacter oryzae]